MAQTFNERFETATNGTALTTSNTAFNAITVGGTATFTEDTSTSAAGAGCGSVTQVANFDTIIAKTAAFTASTTSYTRFCIYLPTLPTGGTLYIAAPLATGSTSGRITINATGNVVLQNVTTTIATSTTVLSASTWYRIEVDWVGTTATVRLYANPTTTTALETISGTVTSSSLTQWSYGIVASSNTNHATIKFDEIVADSALTPGPVVRPVTSTTAMTLTATGTAGPSTAGTASMTITASGSAVSSIQSGDSLMGPSATAGQAAADALHDVSATELGPVYVRGDGALIFTPRHVRYNPTPLWAFGEQELPYTNLAFDFDSTHLTNQVTVSRPGGTTVTVNDAASQKSYYVHNQAFTLQLATDTACLDAANYLLSRYKQPSLRVAPMVLNPIANAALWASVLGMEFGSCVAVNRRPPTTNIITQTTFVDRLEHNIDFSAGGTWTTTVVLTPADVTTYLVWDGTGTYGQWDTACWSY